MKLVILRGLPGSGKSYLAAQILKTELASGKTAEIFSTDNFFMIDGKYVFDASKLPDFHQKNFNAAQAAMQRGLETVIVDNTNTQGWEMSRYINAALKLGRTVEVHTPQTSWAWDVKECTKRNSHGVPQDAIQKMFDRFERELTIDQIAAARPPWYKKK